MGRANTDNCGESLEAAGATPGRREIYLSENLSFLRSVPAGVFDLIYIDPPFNTGSQRASRTTRAERVGQSGGDGASSEGYVGFGGVRYRRVEAEAQSGTYEDAFDDYLGFLEPRLGEAHRVLDEHGSLFVHVDPRESHYVKVLLDGIFGRSSFMNEIVWAYDFGGRTKKRWSSKHDVIFWYAKDPKAYTFNFEAMDRIPYMAPGLVGPEKAARGKTPTDVWWHTIVSPTGKEKTGYPTQKPIGVLERVIKVHSNRGDLVLDFFGGSGTTGAAAEKHGRGFVLVDQSEEAVGVMERRLDVVRSTPEPVRAVS